MRIAVSGTHCCGKSTLIAAFLDKHSEYIHEREAYEELQDLYDEAFSAEPSAEDFYRQLEYQNQRLHQYQPGEQVIFERSPFDYVAYMLALQDLRQNTADFTLSTRSLEIVEASLPLLDLIVYIPISDWKGEVPNTEDAVLRAAMDNQLERILVNDELGLLANSACAVLEVGGNTSERLRLIEEAIAENKQ